MNSSTGSFSSSSRTAPVRLVVSVVIMLVGGAFALLVSSALLFLFSFCLSFAEAGCLGISIVAGLPAISGILAIAMGVLMLYQPDGHRRYAVPVLVLSGITLAVGVVLFFPYPTTLLFLLLSFGWPVILILLGSALAVVGQPGRR